MDFGLAKTTAMGAAAASGAAPLLSTAQTASAGKSPLTGAGQVVGTIQYMSPEQIEGNAADPSSDIFALGAVLYEMVTAKHAFAGKSQIGIASAILEKDPEPISGLVKTLRRRSTR
jgi:serine/threonine protein kinase